MIHMEEEFKAFIREHELKLTSRVGSHLSEEFINDNGLNPNHTFISPDELNIFFEEQGIIRPQKVTNRDELESTILYDKHHELAQKILREQGFSHLYLGYIKPSKYN